MLVAMHGWHRLFLGGIAALACMVGLAPASPAAGGGGPRNGKLLFTRGNLFPVEAERIYSISPSGGTAKPLTPEGSFLSSTPDISPNGKKVAFDSDRPGSRPSQV